MTAETAVEGEVVPFGGPWFEELSVGDVFSAPALTLTDGHAALHQAIIGDRLKLPLDHHLSERVLGSGRRLAHPLLVCDIAIGQSTLPTQRVIGNLFYRRLSLKRSPAIGDTLRTTTEIVALKRNSQKPGRAPTGLAVLRVHTVDQEERDILDYWRCAMLPLKDADAAADRADDLDAFPAGLQPDGLAAAIEGWDLDAFRNSVAGPHFEDLVAPLTWKLEGGESVTCAPELARLSLNIAMTHTDPTAGRNGKRLVYGGHTIGIAAAHVTRVLPNLLTILGWHHCNHTAPVMEGDVLHSVVTLESTEPLPGGGGIVNVHSEVTATREDGSTAKVLDWRLAGALA